MCLDHEADIGNDEGKGGSHNGGERFFCTSCLRGNGEDLI